MGNTLEDTGNFDNKMYITNSEFTYWRDNYDDLNNDNLK